MSQSRLERLQAQADAKPTVSAVAKPYNRKEENKKVLEENRKADHYAFLGAWSAWACAPDAGWGYGGGF